MSAVLEFSNKTFTPPQNAVNREAERYVYFPGDLISPERKRQSPKRYGVGGEDIDAFCLVRTKGVIPKAHIVPLEKAYRWEPRDLLPDGVKGSVQSGPNAEAKFSRWSEGLEGLDVFPGDEVASIISVSMNDSGGPKGIVELTELIGVPFGQDIMDLTRIFLPNGIPKTLREIREGIEKGSQASGEPSHIRIAEQMLKACEMFSYWADAKINEEDSLVKVGTVKGENGTHTYKFTSTTLLLMEQMERERPDHALKDLAGFNANLTEAVLANLQKPDQPAFDMNKLAEVLQANQASIAQMVAQSVAAALAPMLEKQDKPNNPNQKR